MTRASAASVFSTRLIRIEFAKLEESVLSCRITSSKTCGARDVPFQSGEPFLRKLHDRRYMIRLGC